MADSSNQAFLNREATLGRQGKRKSAPKPLGQRKTWSNTLAERQRRAQAAEIAKLAQEIDAAWALYDQEHGYADGYTLNDQWADQALAWTRLQANLRAINARLVVMV